MAKKKGKRKIVELEDPQTGHRTYSTFKNTDNSPDKLELRKYNPLLRKHTIYREVKK